MKINLGSVDIVVEDGKLSFENFHSSVDLSMAIPVVPELKSSESKAKSEEVVIIRGIPYFKNDPNLWKLGRKNEKARLASGSIPSKKPDGYLKVSKQGSLLWTHSKVSGEFSTREMGKQIEKVDPRLTKNRYAGKLLVATRDNRHQPEEGQRADDMKIINERIVTREEYLALGGHDCNLRPLELDGRFETPSIKDYKKVKGIWVKKVQDSGNLKSAQEEYNQHKGIALQ